MLFFLGVVVLDRFYCSDDIISYFNHLVFSGNWQIFWLPKYSYPVESEWTCLSLSEKQAHFQFKGCWIFSSKILIKNILIASSEEPDRMPQNLTRSALFARVLKNDTLLIRVKKYSFIESVAQSCLKPLSNEKNPNMFKS